MDAGGGKGKGGMITFAKNDKTPVEKRNAVCLDCHTKGARIFWKGSPTSRATSPAPTATR